MDKDEKTIQNNTEKPMHGKSKYSFKKKLPPGLQVAAICASEGTHDFFDETNLKIRHLGKFKL